MSSALNVHINIDFNAELPVEQFDMIQQMILALQNAGVNVSAAVTSTDNKSAIRRGASRKPNGADARSSPPPPDDVLGDTSTAQDEGEEDLGLPAAQGLSPEESYERAMGYARHLHNAKHKDPINKMRKHFGVTKFTEIPLNRAGEFLTMAEAEGNKVGIHL
jgi:hypothetical protein